MSEDVNAATKLYIKDEDDKVRRDVKEDFSRHRKEVNGELKKAKTASSRAFAAITGAVGIVTVLCAWGLSENAVRKGIEQTVIPKLIAQIQKHEEDAGNALQHIHDLEEIASNSGLLLPIGTILPVAGSLDEIKKLEKRGWYVCDGTREGVPDLTGRFLRGGVTSGDTDDAAPSTGFRDGGTDLDAHKHETPITNCSNVAALTVGSPWETGSATRKKHEVPIRGGGGEYPSNFKLTNTPYGEKKLNNHTHSVSIVPKYYSVIYIMRVEMSLDT